jgi:hypothetical protein
MTTLNATHILTWQGIHTYTGKKMATVVANCYSEKQAWAYLQDMVNAGYTVLTATLEEVK